MLRGNALTWPLAVVVGLGLAAMLVRRETRWAAVVVAGPTGRRSSPRGASTPPTTADARHLNAIYPLLAAFVSPGAQLVVRALGFGHRNWAAPVQPDRGRGLVRAHLPATS